MVKQYITEVDDMLEGARPTVESTVPHGLALQMHKAIMAEQRNVARQHVRVTVLAYVLGIVSGIALMVIAI